MDETRNRASILAWNCYSVQKIWVSKIIFEGVSLVDDKRGRSGLLWLIFGPFCWISSLDKGNSDFQLWPHIYNCEQAICPSLAKIETLAKVINVTFENQLTSKAFTFLFNCKCSPVSSFDEKSHFWDSSICHATCILTTKSTQWSVW